MKLSGPNTAFSLIKAIEAGGMEQPTREDGTVDLKEITVLVSKIQRIGYGVNYLPERVISSRRRHLMELIKGKQMYFLDNQRSRNPRFLTIRANERALLEYALKHVPLFRWEEYRRSLISKIISNTLDEELVEEVVGRSL